jgi:uncharacterized protein
VSQVALIVIAKEPVPGRVKTRLSPPLSPLEAARVAEAALADTLETVAATTARRRVLALDGAPGQWLPPGFDVVPQPSGGLAERLAAAFAAVAPPALLVGMDTPQVSAELLSASAAALERDGTDAVLGPAHDGGYWAIGLREAVPAAFEGVPMSSRSTLREQRRALRGLGLRWRELPGLTDVDTFEDALSVAAGCPGGRFAAALTEAVGEPRPERAPQRSLRVNGAAAWAPSGR